MALAMSDRQTWNAFIADAWWRMAGPSKNDDTLESKSIEIPSHSIPTVSPGTRVHARNAPMIGEQADSAPLADDFVLHSTTDRRELL